MNNLIFGTTNKNKLIEAESILGQKLDSVEFDIDEIQSLDPQIVAEKKARAYFAKINKMIFVEDVSVEIEALSGLPGAYIKDFLDKLGNDGLVSLIPSKAKRNTKAKTVLVLIDDKSDSHLFEATMEGEISNIPKGTNGFGWDPIFIPNGSTKTLAEMNLEEKNKFSMRSQALLKLKKFLADHTP